MTGWAGVVLAGGRSSRMGTSKAALEWHGSTLLRRTVGIVARATGGPVVVVRAGGQALPPLPPGTLVVDDPRDGKGPLQGIAAGLAELDAAGGRGAAGTDGEATGTPEIAFVSSTDMPFLHPAFVRCVLRALAAAEGADVALPAVGGYRQPLAAAYRLSLAATAERLVGLDRLKPAFLFDECTVVPIDEARLLRDPVLAAVDPGLESVRNVNSPADYQQARSASAPLVTVALDGGLGPAGLAGRAGRPAAVRAATVRGAAEAAGLAFGGPVVAALNGAAPTADPETPLATGDSVVFTVPTPASRFPLSGTAGR